MAVTFDGGLVDRLAEQLDKHDFRDIGCHARSAVRAVLARHAPRREHAEVVSLRPSCGQCGMPFPCDEVLEIAREMGVPAAV